jgi:hypothetical protein
VWGIWKDQHAAIMQLAGLYIENKKNKIWI